MASPHSLNPLGECEVHKTIKCESWPGPAILHAPRPSHLNDPGWYEGSLSVLSHHGHNHPLNPHATCRPIPFSLTARSNGRAWDRVAETLEPPGLQGA